MVAFGVWGLGFWGSAFGAYRGQFVRCDENSRAPVKSVDVVDRVDAVDGAGGYADPPTRVS